MEQKQNNRDVSSEVKDLRKMRSVLESVRQATANIYEDLAIARKNHETIHKEASEAKGLLDAL
ncbi:Piso0_000443 [Millerozyma farinosa CBS 7064]|uniref:Piso0_000443 protein n=1 Tax=Pichia sorbitophila (strain ATCC MYA-4447 / BCRC 22081 / CBS 7064 / NBRC 10061 / NRRL Y-12695) TaxID=559304 RepID=G8YU04_PICSO|nr:Piso0_000443 [Millerozyma farinosa CBS 7064]CCE73405.1 Piso0_000443 [Millerozyma farinosa CBS 7064]